MIAKDLNVVALTQYIPALKGKITPETFTRLNALLIEKLQQESSSPLVKRIQMKVKETLLLRLVDE